MEVQNYNRFIPDADTINISDLCCKWPFRMSVIGPSGSGKTNMVIDMVLNHIYFDDIYVLAKDLEEPLYEFLKAKLEDINRMIDEKGIGAKKGIHFSSDMDLDIDSLNKERQSLIIIDDMITKRDQTVAEDLFLRGRKKNASTLYLSQSYFQIPKIVRLNSSYFALFNIPNKRELRSIVDVHSTRYDFHDFMNIYKEVHKEPWQFLLIDNVSNDPIMHLRKCWDGMLVDY